MDNLIAPKGMKAGIFRCLKAGVNPKFPEQGTPQGGVASPLLANIALNGIEECHTYKLLTRAINGEQFKWLHKRRVSRERSFAQYEVDVVCYVNSYGCY